MIQPPDDLISKLKDRYGEPQRAYHTWQHITALLGHFETVKDRLHAPPRVLWALYWHDAIYDPMRPDNEQVSADLLREDGQGHLAEGMLEDAAIIIEATAKHVLPEDRLSGGALSDAAYFLDMDLSILAASEDVFDHYEENIRFEYSFVPIETYRQARGGILKAFLERPQLYFTDHYRALWEDRARDNLKRSVAGLEAG